MKRFLFSVLGMLCTYLISGQNIVTVNNAYWVNSANTQVTIQGGITFSGTAQCVDNGTFNLVANPAAGSEDWTNSTGSTFYSGNGTVNLLSNANQSIIGNNNFYNLRLNFAAANLRGIYTGTNPLLITNNLALDNGLLQLPAGVRARVTNPALTSVSTTGIFDNNYVLGRLERTTNTNAGEYFYPIGKDVGGMTGLIYAPVRFTRNNASTTLNYYAEYIRATPVNRNAILNPPIDHVSGLEYWNIASDATVGQAATDDVTLSLSYRGSSVVDANPANRADMLIAHYGDIGMGNIWFPEGVSSAYSNVTGSATFGWVTANAVTTGYTTDNFTLASRSMFNILPIGDINWDVQVQNGFAFPYWNIRDDSRVQAYTVERSTDGINFSDLQQVNSLQTLNSHQYRIQDPTAISGCVFYRLKVVDQSNRATYLPIRKVCAGAGSNLVFKLYPNPAHQQVYLQIPSNQGQGYQMVVTDALGQIISKKNTLGGVTEVIGLQRLAAGVYHIRVYESNKMVYDKLFIKKL
jgi:hypothetical protein